MSLCKKVHLQELVVEQIATSMPLKRTKYLYESTVEVEVRSIPLIAKLITIKIISAIGIKGGRHGHIHNAIVLKLTTVVKGRKYHPQHMISLLSKLD